MMNNTDSKMTEYQKVVQAILFGKFDTQQLAGIGQVLRTRAAELARETKRELRLNMMVKFTDNRKGRTFTGTVVAIKRKNVVVLVKRQNNPGLIRDVNYNVPAQLIEIAA